MELDKHMKEEITTVFDKHMYDYALKKARIELCGWKQKYLRAVYNEDANVIDKLYKKHIITKEEVKIAKGELLKRVTEVTLFS